MVDISKLKFRHLYGEFYKKKFECLTPSTSSSESCGIKGNPKFFAFSWKTNGGGALAVFQNQNYQKLSKMPPLLTGHQGQINDFDFNPFNDNQLATASEDTTIKYWQLPEEINDDITEPIATLNGHQKKIQLIAFNHISSNVLASVSSDLTLKLWNLNKTSEALSIAIPDQTWGLQWNITANLLGMVNKDKSWRIIDPRSNQITSTTKAHQGPKNQKFTWIGEQNCLTTGLSKSFERQFYLYDIRNTEKPIQSQVLDNSSGTLFPFFDNDTNILFLAGKGDANIRYYEFSENQLFFCSNFSSTKSGMGYGFYNKRTVDVSIHEIMRGLKLTDSTVEFIKFCAPRKVDTFQDDLFPNTFGHIPSQSAEDWFENKNAPAILVSLNPNNPTTTIYTGVPSQHIFEQSAVLQQSMEVVDTKDTKVVVEKYEKQKIENNELKKKNKEQLVQIEQLDIVLKSQADQQTKTNKQEQSLEDLQEKLENEQEKNRKLHFKISILEQKVQLLEKSATTTKQEGESDDAKLTEFMKAELEFINKLQELSKEREMAVKSQLK